MRRKRRKGLREGKEQEGEKEERSKRREKMTNQGKGNIEEESKDRKK